MSAGQRLILGLDKPYLTPQQQEFLSKNQLGGVILFDRNGTDKAQLEKLIDDVYNCLSDIPFVAIDFEGGRVRRMKELFPVLEKASDYIGNLNKLKDDCHKVGEEFARLKINVNFAPVADILYDPLNPALRDRAYSDDSLSVNDYCKSFIQAFSDSGILCCLKHFPGLGSAINDPHDKTAVSCIPYGHLAHNDFVPYKSGITNGIKFIMTTHVLMTSLDMKIATFSNQTTGLLRSLGFEGIIVTDDLSMGAVKDSRPIKEIVLEALCAGHDMALVCHNHEEHQEIVDYLEDNLDTLKNNGHEQAIARINDVKKSLPKRHNWA
jgi:beta-N-acetylhexosaminidase